MHELHATHSMLELLHLMFSTTVKYITKDIKFQLSLNVNSF